MEKDSGLIAPIKLSCSVKWGRWAGPSQSVDLEYTVIQ